MPMHESQALQSCISHCQVTLNDLQNLARTAANAQARSMIEQASQSLNDCIQKCRSAAQQF